MTYNIFGSRTARTAIYGVTEVGAKLLPVILVFGIATHRPKSPKQDSVVEVPLVAVERRSTLTQ